MMRRLFLRLTTRSPPSQSAKSQSWFSTYSSSSPKLQTPLRSLARTRTSWQPLFSRISWQVQQSRRYGRRGFNYTRFQQNLSLLQRWHQHPRFYYHVGAITAAGGTFYVVNLEDVPVSHRRRFRAVPYSVEAALGKQMYQQTMEQYRESLLPPSHPYYKMVQRVADRLIPHSDLADAEWELNVIQDPQRNAFVVPGGKIFVFTGMFDICKTDDSLAAVIGHEIAHNVAHHAAERASTNFILMGASVMITLVTGGDLGQDMVLDLVFGRPGSRAQESEADYIGLLMMAEACYDPSAAMDMWATMEKLDQGSPPQWLSTHPSNHNRLEKIRGWLPLAEQKLEESGCSLTRAKASEFWPQAMAYK